MKQSIEIEILGTQEGTAYIVCQVPDFKSILECVCVVHNPFIYCIYDRFHLKFETPPKYHRQGSGTLRPFLAGSGTYSTSSDSSFLDRLGAIYLSQILIVPDGLRFFSWSRWLHCKNNDYSSIDCLHTNDVMSSLWPSERQATWQDFSWGACARTVGLDLAPSVWF
jgi:hypothetical protein